MTFFNPKKSRSRQIEIDPARLSSESPEVRRQLDRIEDNYRRLDLMFADVELKIRSDARLNAIDQSITEIEIEVDGRKRKWRSRKPKPKSAGPKKSADPKKPR